MGQPEQCVTAPPTLVAEIELSVLIRQCLDRRTDDLDDLDVLNTELTAWQNATNADQRQVDWHFITADARIKLRHLYPNSCRRRSTSFKMRSSYALVRFV